MTLLTRMPVGTKVPPLEREIRLVDMVAYAGATWDWHPIHYDRDHIQRMGLSAPVVDGQAMGAYLAEHVLDLLGPTARVRRMAFRLRGTVFAGDTIRIDGQVSAVGPEDDGWGVTFTQSITVGDRIIVEGAETLVVLRT